MSSDQSTRRTRLLSGIVAEKQGSADDLAARLALADRLTRASPQPSTETPPPPAPPDPEPSPGGRPRQDQARARAPRQGGRPRSPVPKRRVTLYLDIDALSDLEALRIECARAGGRVPTLSAVVEAAIRAARRRPVSDLLDQLNRAPGISRP